MQLNCGWAKRKTSAVDIGKLTEHGRQRNKKIDLSDEDVEEDCQYSELRLAVTLLLLSENHHHRNRKCAEKA